MSCHTFVCFLFQCGNGHLMCAGCFNHLLADARLKDETATCPNCRCEINKNVCIRNLAVEKAVSELPSECGYCSQQLPRYQVDHHQRELCQERWELFSSCSGKKTLTPSVSSHWSALLFQVYVTLAIDTLPLGVSSRQHMHTLDGAVPSVCTVAARSFLLVVVSVVVPPVAVGGWQCLTQ